MKLIKDKATYPNNGIIYEGDYLQNIPFDEYIHKMNIPTDNVYDIRNFGAIPNSEYLSTDAFNMAVQEAGKTKGTVVISGGTYIVGSVYLLSDITLFIDYGSSLIASKDLDKFTDAMIAIKDVSNVVITGGGKIHGNGEYFVNLPKEKPLLKPLGYTKLPPRLLDPLGYPEDTIRFKYRERIRYADDRWKDGSPDIQRPMYTLWIRGSENIRVENIILEDSLDWTINVDYSRNINIKDVVINNNRHVANTDGIDVICSEDTTVEHIFVSTADDGLCVKAPMKQGHDGLNVEDSEMAMGPTKNIHFRNCTVCSVMNAFKIGTETYFDIENVTLEDCTFIMPDIYPGGVSGISIESSDGTNVRNVKIKNIKMNNIVCPIYIGLNRRCKFGFLSKEDEKKKKNGGSIDGIEIENVYAENVEIPSLLTGFYDGEYTGTIKNIKIKDFTAKYLDNNEILDIIYPLYENIIDYPESNAFGDLPAYGFFIRHADNVLLENINVIPRTMNKRELYYQEDTKDLAIR